MKKRHVIFGTDEQRKRLQKYPVPGEDVAEDKKRKPRGGVIFT